jgi:hypothetical protein
MYFPDLSPCQYIRQGEDPPPLNIGWLDQWHEYSQTTPSGLFVDRLWSFCRLPVHQTLGYYQCELCTEPPFGLRVQRGEEELWLGDAEIRVFGNGDVVYAAPNLIYHYVVHHHYSPPEEFIQSVLEGPLPDSPEYLSRSERFLWGRILRLQKRRT